MLWTVVLEKTLESPLDCNEIKPVNPEENQLWICIGRTDAKTEAPILGPPDAKNQLGRKPWYWERLKAGGEGDNRGWDGWTASLTQWRWFWVNSGSWWWTGRPGVLRFMGLQRVRHDWETELNWTEAFSHSSDFAINSVISPSCHSVGVPFSTKPPLSFWDWTVCLVLCFHGSLCDTLSLQR